MHESIKRSRAGLRAVLLSLAVLGLTAVAQTLVFALSGSVALLADLIHNFGDALTAVPLGIAFCCVRARRARRGPVRGRRDLRLRRASPGSRRCAGSSTRCRLTTSGRWPPPARSGTPAIFAARSAPRAGERLDSPALIADGHHARADAYVSLAVIASAVVVALGVPIADPLIGLAITLVILRITWQSWRTVAATTTTPTADSRSGRGGPSSRRATRFTPT